MATESSQRVGMITLTMKEQKRIAVLEEVFKGDLLWRCCAQEALAWIDGDAGDSDFVVQMRTGALPGISHLRDCLSSMDMFSLVDENLGEVGVLSFDVLAVVQDNRPVFAVGGLDNRVTGGMHRRAYRLGYIQPRMVLHLTRQGRWPHPKTGDDPSFYGPIGGERSHHPLKLALKRGEKLL